MIYALRTWGCVLGWEINPEPEQKENLIRGGVHMPHLSGLSWPYLHLLLNSVAKSMNQ